MPAKSRFVPRQIRPEREHDYVRSPDLGYESPDETGLVTDQSSDEVEPLTNYAIGRAKKDLRAGATWTASTSPPP